ncbi:MAG: DUF885 family protein [Oscillospiraceae bacterium]|nr:DUF885 family protein [Oscillospiraceae bacterium]
MKKLILCGLSWLSTVVVVIWLLVSPVTAPCVSAEPAGQTDMLPGDVDGNGILQISDARILLQHLVQKDMLDWLARQRADVDDDGVTDISDARLILQKLVGKISDFPDNPARRSFKEFSRQMFEMAVLTNTFNLHFNLAEPPSYGIPELAPSWGFMEIYSVWRMREKFQKFDRALLSPVQQIDYDLMAYDFALDAGYDPAFAPLANWMEVNDGDHVGIPLTLAEYPFGRERDITDYLTLLDTYHILTDEMIDQQRMKAEKNTFMSEDDLDGVLKEIRAFIDAGKKNVLLTSFDLRIGNCPFLDESQKTAYIEQNKSAVETVLQAYSQLSEDLEELRGSCGPAGRGMADYENGRAYYRYRMKAMGMSMTPEQLIAALDRQIGKVYDNIMAAVRKDSSIVSKNVTVPKKIEDYIPLLRTRAAADFPGMPASLTYKVNIIDESLADSARPAFYFPPQLDKPDNNIIYINPKSAAGDPVSNFITMAHEGIPGHMQQFGALGYSNQSAYRKLSQSLANAEGWAIHAQFYAYQYTDGVDTVKQYLRDNEEWGFLLQMRLEIGVNYENWTAKRVQNELSNWFKMNYPPSSAEKHHADSASHPFRTLPYLGGYLEVLALRDRYSSVTDKAFHTALLDLGCVPFAVAQKHLDVRFGKAAA